MAHVIRKIQKPALKRFMWEKSLKIQFYFLLVSETVMQLIKKRNIRIARSVIYVKKMPKSLLNSNKIILEKTRKQVFWP